MPDDGFRMEVESNSNPARENLVSREQSQSRNMLFVYIGIGLLIVVLIGGGIYMMMPFKCTEEQRGCTECKNAETCEECAEGFKLEGAICEFQCLQDQTERFCTKCYDSETCTGCIDGYEPVLEGQEKGICQFQCIQEQKDAGCNACGDAKSCDKCIDGYEVYDVDDETRSCHYVCNKEQKAGNCSDCSDPQTCTSCISEKYELEEGKCHFKCTDTPNKQVAHGCKRCEDENTCTECLPGHKLFDNDCVDMSVGEKWDCNNKCCRANTITNMGGGTYYTYRAKNGANYPINGLNTASAGGVMRYINEEVVGYDCCAGPDLKCKRKYEIDRIQRYKVSMKNPGGDPWKFTEFMQFDKAQCTWGGVTQCMNRYRNNGYTVGCQVQGKNTFFYSDAVWMSYPGTCPSKDFNSKSEQCKEDEPGGECDFPDGSKDCTYHLEPAGEVMLDELTGIDKLGGYGEFCRSGKIEFVLHPDGEHVVDKYKGKKPDVLFWQKPEGFWKNPPDNIPELEEMNDLRTKLMLRLFKEKYGS